MYIKKLGIQIRELKNNHPVHRNSIFLAKYVAKKRFKNILEIGTGTGVIALYLAKNGCGVTATDIDQETLNIACQNAKLNNLNVQFIVSDLYEKVDGKYDCIIFVPPYFNFPSFSSLAFIFEKIFPTFLETRIDHILDLFFFGGKASLSRRKLIKIFLEQSRAYLVNKGSIFLMVFKSDIPFLRKFSYITYERIPMPFFAAIAILKIKYKP